MKTTTRYLTADQRQEVERFKRASDELVRRAKKDKNVALQFLREAGYFDIVPEALAEVAAQGVAAQGVAAQEAASTATVKAGKVKTRPARLPKVAPGKLLPTPDWEQLTP